MENKKPCVWVAYHPEKPYLPMAVEDSARELAKVLGVRKNNVESVASKHKKGKIKRPRYACVYIGE